MKKGWPTQTLQSLCEDVNVGHVGPSSMHRDPNGISFLMGKNVGTGVIYTHNIERVTEAFHRSQPKSRLRPGDIVVVRIGKSGQAAKIPEGFGEANCSGLVVIKKPHGIHPDFLVYYLNSPIGRGYSLSQARGSTRLTLNTSSVAETLVPVPPLAEQQRIVGVLDEAMAGIATARAHAETNLQNARALFESHLHAVFTQRGPGWVETTLGDVCDFLNGFAFKSGDAVPGSHTQLVRMGNLYGNQLDLERSPVFYPDHFATEYSRYLLAEGDIIMSLTGTTGKEDYGYAVRIPDCGHSLLMNQRIMKFEAMRPDIVDDGFLLHYLRSRIFLDILYPTANGTRQANLSSVTMKTLPVPLPPLKKQKLLVTQLDALSAETQRLAALYERKLAALEELKKSLLHQAFAGEL